MAVARPPKKPVFGKKNTIRFNDFSGGLNNKFSPLLLAPNELSDVQNFTYDEKGTLQKRKGYVRHYATAFGTGPIMGMTNYRKEDGTSRMVVVCDGKIFYDKPQFSTLYNSQALWETTGTQRKFVDTTTTVGSVQHAKGQGTFSLWRLASRIGLLGGPKVLEEGQWVSNVIDISTVTDKTTGTVTLGQTIPTGASIAVETRVSPDGTTTWDAWLALGGGSSIQAVGTRNFLQVRARFNSTTRRRGVISSYQVKFDVTPTVTTLTSGLSTSDRWEFATMNDILWGVDGSDANIKWDATTLGTMGGTPPTCQHIVVHKNFMFLAGNSSANRSRLYFSDIGSPESWPALNFIDVGKGDGDAITGLQILNDQLAIYKDHSCWMLQGDSPTNFTLRKATDEAGTVSGKSTVISKNSAGILDRNGYFFFDGARVVLASEKIQGTLAGLNQRQLQKVAAVWYQKKIWIALPEGGPSQLTNNVVIVFDTLRNAWTVFRGINASEFVIWRQQNADTLLFGSSLTGQVYDLEMGYNDDGTAIDAYFVTRAVDFGAAELLNLVRRCLLTGKDPLGGTISALVSFFMNLGAETGTQTATYDKSLNVVAAYPGKMGIGPVHSLAMKVRHNTINQGMNVYSIAMEYVRKGIRVTG